MGSAASDRTGADRPLLTRVALGLVLATLMLCAPGAVANARASVNVGVAGTGGAVVARRSDSAMLRASRLAKRTSDVIPRCKPLAQRASADLDVETRADLAALAHAAGPRRLSGQTNQASSADPPCEELSASEYSLVWPSLQATGLTIAPASGLCFDVSRPVRGTTSRPPILPFTPRPPPVLG